MPVARIVTAVAPESPAIHEIAEQLRASGYEVTIGTEGAPADLTIELDEVGTHDALNAASRMARQTGADVYIAPGVFAGTGSEVRVPGPEPGREHTKDPAVETKESMLASTVEQLGVALHEGRSGIQESVADARSRVSAAWGGFAQRRAEAALQRRQERERRDAEREERRQIHEADLKRRAEENERMAAERERQVAEQARLVREQMAREAIARAERESHEREQMAREAAVRAERERLQREEVARETARRAEIARREEQERQRVAALAAATQPQQRELRPLAAETSGTDIEKQPLVDADAPPVPAHRDAAPVFAARTVDVVRTERPRLVRPPRRVATPRERQWQQAAFIASVATLAAMLGFAIASNTSPSAPLPQSLMQNSAQQQVPFGPAKMDVPTAAKPPAVRSSVPAAKAPVKPSPIKVKPARRRAAREDDIAEDEVIVRHAPTSRAQRAQTQRAPSGDGIRRYSDDN